MIREDYVSFESAKLLKEKGFDTPTKIWYGKVTSHWGGDSSGDRTYINEYKDSVNNHLDDSFEFLCYRPTLQMAMKWLREAHNIHIVVNCGFGGERKWFSNILNIVSHHKYPNSTGYFNSYEEACDEAIIYCLENLI